MERDGDLDRDAKLLEILLQGFDPGAPLIDVLPSEA
jgi:hypothetical protein